MEEQVFRTKGLVFKGFVDFIHQNFGEEAFEAWKTRLSPRSQEVFLQPILSTSWYPGELAVEMRQAICEQFYGGDTSQMRELGRFQAERILRGVYRIFIKMGSPEWVAQRASRVLSMHFEPGHLAVLTMEKGHAHLKLTDFPDNTGIMENIFFGFMEVAMRLSGADLYNITMPHSLARGDSYSEFELFWRPL